MFNSVQIVGADFDSIVLEEFEGVLLDLDDTLYRYAPCHEAAIRECFEHCDFNFSWLQFQSNYRDARNRVTELLAPQAACRSRLFAFEDMAEKAGVANPYKLANKLEIVYWDRFIETMVLDQKAFNFLVRCQQMRVPTCIVTDMTASIQIKKIERLGLTSYISQLVTSEEVGAEKPNPNMFERAAQKLGVDIARCLMLGDSIPKDVEGASALGIKAHLISLSPTANRDD